MKPIKNFIVAVGLTLVLSAITNNAHAQVSNMQEKVKNYFLQTLKKKQNEEQKSKDAFQRNKTYTTDGNLALQRLANGLEALIATETPLHRRR